MTSLAKALEIVEGRTGATREQTIKYLTQAANEGVVLRIMEAESNERVQYPPTPIPFPDLRNRYRAVKKIDDGTLWDKNGRMPGNDVNAAIHGANYYPRLFEYALMLHEENKDLKRRLWVLENELES